MQLTKGCKAPQLLAYTRRGITYLDAGTGRPCRLNHLPTTRTCRAKWRSLGLLHLLPEFLIILLELRYLGPANGKSRMVVNFRIRFPSK